MNRRSFLQLLGMAAPAAVIAPKYFLAPIGGWRSDVIVNPSETIALQHELVRAELDTLYESDPRLWGLMYVQSANVGQWMGIERSAYPGRLVL